MSYEGTHIKVKADDSASGSFGYKFDDNGGEIEITSDKIKLRVSQSDNKSLIIDDSANKITLK